jgi:uncharacterized protein
MTSGGTSEQPGRREGGGPPAAPPHRVRVPVNVHHWDNIAFLHWPFEPDVLAPLVPDDAQVLTCDGAAWMSVTPFFIRVRPPAVPAVPPGWAFPETNLRTYVTAPDGREGLWFIRMEVTALWFVVTLRALGLPYVRRRMSVDLGRERITYRSGPRSSPDGDGSHIVVRPGTEIDPPAGDPRDRFLTARWGVYHRRGPARLYTPVEHPPWALHTATVETCEVDELFRSGGLPTPSGPPLAHFSHGVTAKVGRPGFVA